MNLIKYRNYFFVLSLLIIIPGIFAFLSWGLRVGIDFAGGTLWEITSQESIKQLDAKEVKDFLITIPTEVSQTSQTSTNSVILRIKETDETKIKDIKQKLNEKFGATEDVRLETVGPTISRELTQKALLAVGVSILAIGFTFVYVDR